MQSMMRVDHWLPRKEEGGGGMDYKGTQGNFGSDGNVCYFDWDESIECICMSELVKLNPLSVQSLLYLNYISNIF